MKEQTGRDLTIVGDITLTFFPWIGVTTGAVEISNAPGFSPDIFASTQQVSIRVKLIPLLSKTVEMDTVSIRGLTLNLARDDNGNTNWDDLAQGNAEQTTKDSGGSGVSALAIGGLDISDANISWSDAATGQLLTVSNLNATSGTLTSGHPVDFSVKFDLAGGPGNMGGRFDLIGRLSMDPDSAQFDAKRLKFTANLTDDVFLPGGKATFVFAADVSANMNKMIASLANLNITLLGLEASGKFSVSDYEAPHPQLSGNLSIKQFDPKTTIKQLIGMEFDTADPTAVTALGLDLAFDGNTQGLAFKPLKIQIDDATVQGELSTGPAVRFKLNLDGIDVDRYLPPASEDETMTTSDAGTGGEFPVGAVHSLDVDGQLQIGKLKVKNLNATDIKITFKAKDGVVHISPIIAKLYEGAYSGNIGIDATGSQPMLTVNEKLSSIQAGPLLKDLRGEDHLTGTGNLQAKMTAVGANSEAMKKPLTGTAEFSFTDGALNGINIAETIRNAKAKVLGGTGAETDGPKKTDFSELSGSFLIKNGFITNEDFSVKSPLLRIKGRGNADLPSETIDYHATTTVVATTQGQGGEGLEDLAGIPILIKIGGTFAQPSYGLDFETLAGALLKSKTTGLIGGSAENLIEGVSGGTEGVAEGVAGGVKAAGEILKETTKGAGSLLDGLLGN